MEGRGCFVMLCSSPKDSRFARISFCAGARGTPYFGAPGAPNSGRSRDQNRLQKLQGRIVVKKGFWSHGEKSVFKSKSATCWGKVGGCRGRKMLVTKGFCHFTIQNYHNSSLHILDLFFVVDCCQTPREEGVHVCRFSCDFWSLERVRSRAKMFIDETGLKTTKRLCTILGGFGALPGHTRARRGLPVAVGLTRFWRLMCQLGVSPSLPRSSVWCLLRPESGVSGAGVGWMEGRRV